MNTALTPSDVKTLTSSDVTITRIKNEVITDEEHATVYCEIAGLRFFVLWSYSKGFQAAPHFFDRNNYSYAIEANKTVCEHIINTVKSKTKFDPSTSAEPGLKAA